MNGDYIVGTDCDEVLQLILWKKDSDKEEVKHIQSNDEGVRNVWNFHAENEIIVGIGLLSANFAVLRNFVFRRQITKGISP